MSILMASELEDVGVLPTNTFLDEITGIGGLPRGRITEIYGREGLGKTTVCLQAIANVQKNGGKCLFVDVEWAFAPEYAENLGVDKSKLGVLRDTFAEHILEAVLDEIEKDEWDLIIVDALGALMPREEAEKDVGSSTYAPQAKILSRFMRKVTPALHPTKTAMIVLNHETEDMGTGRIGSSGGRKLAHHKALSIRLRPKPGVKGLTQGNKKVGKAIRAEVRNKNKVAATEGKEMDLQIIFGKGFSEGANVLNIAIDKGVIEQRGKTYWLGEEKLAVGLAKTRQMLEEDSVLLERVKSKLP